MFACPAVGAWNPGRNGTANTERVSHMEHTGDLDIRRVAKFAEVLESNRRLQCETIGQIGLQVDIGSDTILVA